MITITAVALAVFFVGQAPQAPPSISSYDRGASLTMLHHVKADLKNNYYDKTFRGMDVEAVFDEAEKNLKNATSVNAAVAVIAEVLMRLDDSHTTFVPPDRKTQVDYGWFATMVGDEPYVATVVAGSDAEKKGLAPGDRILAWNRYEVSRKNLWQINYLYRFVRPQQLQRVLVRKPDGTERAYDIASKVEVRGRMDMDDLFNLIVQSLSVTDNREVTVGDTFLWRYTSFLDPDEVDRVMKKAKKSKSLVIDLRGNGGGNVEALRKLVSQVFDRDIQVAVEKSRKGDKAMVAKGKKDAFTGPLTVLVDSGSGSASEIFARVVQLEKRGAVIGDRTAGAVMTAQIFPHTVGIDALAFFATSITVGDVRMSDGASLEHVGVTPDEIALPTAADLAGRRDPILSKALAAFGAQVSAEQAGGLYRVVQSRSPQ